MRRDELYLHDALAAADSIAEFIRDVTPEEFADSDLIRSAVLQKLIVIGEAAANISQPTRELVTAIPWTRIVAFRNLAVHRYFRIDWPVVWTTASEQVPVFRDHVHRFLSERGQGPILEYPE